MSLEQHTQNPQFFSNLNFHSQAKSVQQNEEILRQAQQICLDNQKALSSQQNNSIEYN